MAVKKSIVMAVFLGMSVGSSLASRAGTPADVEKVLAEAETSLVAARKAGNSWTSTEKLMAAARQAGSEEEAMELATRALLTADKAREQSQMEQDAWQARVPAN